MGRGRSARTDHDTVVPRATSLPRHAEFDLIALPAMAHSLFIPRGDFSFVLFFQFFVRFPSFPFFLLVERGKAALPEKSAVDARD